MILVDANLLIYACVSGFAQHRRARQWLENALHQGPNVGLPWPSLLAFVRLVSNPRLFSQPQSSIAAWRQVEEWLDVSNVWIPLPGERHREIMRGLLRVAGIQSNVVPDAHLAALAIEHGLILCSTDSGFGRFRDLHWENPITG